ncbi:hypothetical protein LTR64_003726 [Lithohypha guttulata]|uniref:uncharacterized protein n=1 Tax=Lithohypha guttulata TaxID=1690604 RepID=UPI002DDFF8A4|nr:hypothetical protein LTR51_000054 [Lithohypha guttulata]
MEALVALSLACNVLTVIDSSVKLCKGLKAVYDTNGATAENQDLQKSSAELRRITESLDNSIKPANLSNKLSRDEIKLLDIAKRCDSIAIELQDLTSPFTAITGRRNRITLAWKTVKDKKKVEGKQQLLAQYQQHLQTKLLVNILNQHKVTDLERTKGAAQHLDALKRLIDSSTTNHNHLSRLIAQQIAQINDYTSQVIQSAQKYDHEARLLEQLLKSLRSSGMNERENTIVGNHPGTLKWIFADPPSENMASTDTKPSFDSPSAWLEQDTTIYWISGKPGSGKSVLMKSISTSPEALRSLQIWSGGHDVLILRHYFWLAGSEAQKSLKGLFASLLYQVLQQRKSTISTILQRKSADSAIEFSDWSVQELELILQEFLCSISDCVCIFVDGLDEMVSKTDIDEALRFMKHIATEQHIKICVSSRPTQLFCRAFDQVPCLHMHNLNEPDILKYVCESLKTLEDQYGTPGLDNTTTWIDEIHHESTLQNLTKHITKRAEGVFLWAAIVLGQIRDGFVNADTWKILFERVDTYPRELNDLYKSIWRHMNDNVSSYLAEASLYFNFMRFDWEHEMLYLQPSILLMTLYADGKTQTVLPTDIRTVSCDVLIEQCEKMITRARTRCAGLLEVRTYKSAGTHETMLSNGYKELQIYEDRHFSFIHRSAIDFLNDDEFGQNVVRTRLTESFNPYHRLVSAVFAKANLERYFSGEALNNLAKILNSGRLPKLERAQKVALVDKIRVSWAVMLSTGQATSNVGNHSNKTRTAYRTTSLSLPSPVRVCRYDFLAWTIARFGVDYAEYALGDLRNKVSERYIQFLLTIVMPGDDYGSDIDHCAVEYLLSYVPDLNFVFVDRPSPNHLPASLLSCLIAKWPTNRRYNLRGRSNTEAVRSQLAPMVLNWSKIVKAFWSAGHAFERRSPIRVSWNATLRLSFNNSMSSAGYCDESSILLEISDGHLLKLMLVYFEMVDLPFDLQELARSSSSQCPVRPVLVGRAGKGRPPGKPLYRKLQWVSLTETHQRQFDDVFTEHTQKHSLAVPPDCELKAWFERAYAAGTRVDDTVSYMREMGAMTMPDDPDVLYGMPPMFKDDPDVKDHSLASVEEVHATAAHDESALSEDDDCFEDTVSELTVS